MKELKQLISLNGDENTASFFRGNDGDIHISINIPSKKVFLEDVRVGVGNSGGQQVPMYVKLALIEVCNAFDKWNDE